MRMLFIIFISFLSSAPALLLSVVISCPRENDWMTAVQADWMIDNTEAD